jgi:hypothetical protein
MAHAQAADGGAGDPYLARKSVFIIYAPDDSKTGSKIECPV